MVHDLNTRNNGIMSWIDDNKPRISSSKREFCIVPTNSAYETNLFKTNENKLKNRTNQIWLSYFLIDGKSLFVNQFNEDNLVSLFAVGYRRQSVRSRTIYFAACWVKPFRQQKLTKQHRFLFPQLFFAHHAVPSERRCVRRVRQLDCG